MFMYSVSSYFNTLVPLHLFLHLLSCSNMTKLATLFKAQKMLAHLSGTLIIHRVAEIISSQLSNTRQNVMFVSKCVGVMLRLSVPLGQTRLPQYLRPFVFTACTTVFTDWWDIIHIMWAIT